MKTVDVPRRARALHALLKQALTENLLLTTADGREFVLAEVDEFDREITLTRNNRELMKLLSKRGKEKATISLADARKGLGAGR